MRLFFQIALSCITIATIAACPPSFAQSANPSSSAEDFASLDVTSSHLHADPPELVEKDVEPNYTSEWIKVQWRADDPIYLYMVRPTGVSKPPVVIYLYDYPAETDVFRDSEWCERVTSGGYAAVGLVPALNGQRYHGRPMKEWFVSELQEALAQSAHDVQMVLNYLAERADVDMTSVGIFGVGAGATIAVGAASADSRIKAVNLVDPWGNWPVWMSKSDVVPDDERPRYITPEFLTAIAAFDPVSLLPGLRTHAVRLDQSAENSATPPEARAKIEASLPSTAEHRRLADSPPGDAIAASGSADFNWLKLQLTAEVQPAKKSSSGEKNAARQSGIENR